MDKDLDDLLDSALGDFAKKAEPIKTNDQNNKKSQNVTIEKTNLYVDDIDYDDRPARTPATKFVGGISSSSNVSKLLNTATLGANKTTSNSKSSSILTEDSNDQSDFNFL